MLIPPNLRRKLSATALIHSIVNITRMLVSLLTIPALLNHLGANGLGVWLVVLSFQGLFGFLSSGMNSATITTVGRACVSRLNADMAAITASAFYLSLTLSMVFFISGIVVASSFDFHGILNVGSALSKSDMSALIWVMVVVLSFSFVSKFPAMILRGRMDGHIFYGLELLAVLVGASGLLLSVWFGQPIQIMALTYLLPQQVIPFVGGLVWLLREDRNLLNIRNTSKSAFLKLAGEGGKLAVSQAAFSISNSSDMTLIAMFLGAASGAPYGIAQRLFSIPYLLIGTPADALWPVFARADANGQKYWLARSFLKLLSILTLSTAAVAGFLAYYYSNITHFWLGRSLDLNLSLIGGAATLCVLQIYIHITSIFLRSVELSGFLTKSMVLMALVNLPFSVLLINSMGVAGAMWGSVISYSVCLLVPHSIRIWRVLYQRGRSSSIV